MPNFFERLDIALDGNELATRLPEQVSKLTALADTVIGLIKEPPDSLADFSRNLNELPLPDLLGEGFASSLGSLQSALPTELSSVVGDLTNGLSELQTTVSGQLVEILDEALAAILAIYRFTQIDFTCLTQPESDSAEDSSDSHSDPSGGGGSNGDSGDGGSSDSDTQPSGIAEVSNQVNAINDLLDNLPSPFNVANLLDWLNSVVAFRHKAGLLPRTLPVIDDVIDPLNTLLAWNSLNGDQIRDHLAQSLQDLVTFVRSTVHELMSTLAADISATASHLETPDLSQIADDLTTRLQELQAAVHASDLSASFVAVSEINARLDSYDSLRASMQTGLLTVLPALNYRLNTLADDVVDAIGHLISVLRPNPAIGEIANALPKSNTDLAVLENLEEQFQPVADWIRTLTDQLDFQAIQEPLSTVADTARAAVDGLEQGLVQVTIQVRAIFGELESLLDEIDTDTLVNQIKDAIADFETELIQQIESLFAPARDAVSQIIATIDGQIDEFSPDEVIDAFRLAMTSLTSVFKDPAVVSAMDDIRNALDSVKNQIEQLSFAPVTDQVILGLEEISDALQSIDTSELNAALQAVLGAALAILPDNLQPLTDPLIDEFEDLIESGPVPLLEVVKAQPGKLMDKVRSFEPAKLIGEALSKPYADLLINMQAFKPSSLLDPINGEIDKLKERLGNQVNPGQLIELLEPPFNQLLSGFDQFKPEDLVKPLDQAVSDTINNVLDVLPVDEVMAQIDAALDSIKQVADFGQNLVDMFEKINQILADLSDSENQLANWLSFILDKIESIGDLSPLETQFAELASVIDETKEVALTNVFQDAVAPILATLETLNSETRHTTLVQAYSNFPRSILEALPDSAEKSAILAALDRFNPIDPGFGGPYQALLTYQRALSQTQSNLQTALTDWDSRYHTENGTLAEYRIAGVSTTQVRDWVQAEMNVSFLEPLKVLLARIEALASPVNIVSTQITNLVTNLQNKINDLLLGPDSLGGIRNALDELIQRLRDFNLDFLTDSLNEIFDQVRQKINGVNPAQFKEPLNTSFSNMLDKIDLGLIIPAGDLQTLDDVFDDLIDKLKLLNPERLVMEVIQPEYEETILPLIDAFDIAELLGAIIERLRNLDEALKNEMERVNEAFRRMKNSVPTTGAAAGASL